MKLPPSEMLRITKFLSQYAKFAVAILCFPLMGSSCATTDSDAGLSPQEIEQRQRIQARHGHLQAIRSGQINSIPDSNRQVAASAASVQSIRSISNPSQRAAANRAWVESMANDLNSSMHRAGMNQSQINQMAYQSNYDAARRRGSTPAEADAEARQFMQMWQQISR